MVLATWQVNSARRMAVSESVMDSPVHLSGSAAAPPHDPLGHLTGKATIVTVVHGANQNCRITSSPHPGLERGGAESLSALGHI